MKVKKLRFIFDFIFATFAIIALSPFFLIIIILLKIKVKDGDIFHVQKRLGLDQKSFIVYKFRTMVVNADEELALLLARDIEANNYYLKFRKLKNDPRIIDGIGVFLRKSSLDEIPQFINVLKGDMSIVGPRPYLENELVEYDKKIKEIICSTKPGVTGLWQVSDSRNTHTFQERVDMDLDYIKSKSMALDLKIIMKTFLVMIRQSGM
jgi:exopolysaccharide production protein ExoY